MDDIFSLVNDPKKYKKELLNVYRKIFSGTIKETFLTSIFNKVEEDPRYGAIAISSINPNMFTVEATVRGRDHTLTNICKMIVMAHYINSIQLSESERGVLQNSSEYKNQLVDEVVQMYRIEVLASNDFSIPSIEVYLPLIYYSAALINYLGNIFEDIRTGKVKLNEKYNTSFNVTMLYKLILKMKSCVMLADIRALDELTVIFRSLIEMFMTYIALWNQSEEVIQKYGKFDWATYEYNYSLKMPKEYEDEAKKKKVNPVQFLNYGWIEDLPEFKKLDEKQRSFKIGTLADILDIKYSNKGKGFGSVLYKIYRSCNPQAHGTTLFMNAFHLELSIFQNIEVMLKFLCELLSKELLNAIFVVNGVDLLNELEKAYKKSVKVYQWLFNNDPALEKTNLDYQTRAFVSMKLKR